MNSRLVRGAAIGIVVASGLGIGASAEVRRPGGFPGTILQKATNALSTISGLDLGGREIRRTQDPAASQDPATAQDPVAPPAPLPPMVMTDKTGYFAGERALISGTGFAAGDVLTLQVKHVDGGAETGMGHEPFTAVVGDDGTFTAEWSIGSHLGAAEFFLTTKANFSPAVSDVTFGRIAFISTDKFDYTAGATALISGMGFLPEETVTVRVQHSNGLNDGAGHQPYQVQADASGTFTSAWYVNPDDSLRAIMRVSATGLTSGLMANTTFTDPPVTIVDDGGPDDFAAAQRDLSQMQFDYSNRAAGTIAVTWNWDDTAWTGGGNTGDACAHFDSNGNGNANSALCITVRGNPATMVVGSLRRFSCDDLAPLCSNSALAPGFASTAIASVSLNSDPFRSIAAHTTPPLKCNGADCASADTVANLTVVLADVGGGAARLTNVCSYPSSSALGNHSDCVAAPNNGFLTIKKTTQTTQTATTSFSFDTSPASESDVATFSANIASSQTDVPVAESVSFAATDNLSLTEIVPAGWDLTAASCAIQAGAPIVTGGKSGNAVTDISIKPGLETVCTFTNKKQNAAPDAVDDDVTVAEDSGETAIAVLSNDTDADGDSLSVTAVTQGISGAVTFTATGVGYTPNAGFNGSDSFTYTISDGNGGTDTATVNVTVTAVNDAPDAVDDAATVAEDSGPNTIAVLANDTDADADALTVTAVTQGVNGVVTFTATGVSYAPNANFNGSDSFTYTISDGNGGTDTATVNVTVTAVNDGPDAVDDTATVAEDSGANAVNVLANDTDDDGDTLTVTAVTQGANGSVTFSATGVSYTPNPDFNGSDSFTYTASDGNGGTDTATVNVTVTAVNDAPVAVNDAATTDEDVFVDIPVIANDTDVDTAQASLSVKAGSIAAVTGGTAVLLPDGRTVRFTPSADANSDTTPGGFSFTYVATDGTADSNVATVSITVTPVNDAPVAVDDGATTLEDTPATGNVLTNDSDVDGDSLTASKTADPASGSVVLNEDGSFTYTPNANFNGTDTFKYKASDGTLQSSEATVTITITPVNDAPVADAQSVTTDEDTPKAITLTASDVDGDTLTYAVVTSPAHGALTGTGANLTYTPAANYHGPDSFTFKVNDGQVDSSVATVSITVNAVNDAPVADAQSVTTDEDTPKPVTLTGSDVDGDSLTYAVLTSPAHGTLTGTGANLTYTPNANFNGSDSFTFRVNDGTADSNVATVTITVTAVNDAPVANPQGVTTAEDTPKGITLSGSDIDGDPLTYTVLSLPTNGTLSGTGANLTYTPAANYHGPDSFTFRVNDGTVDSNVATISITVTPVNDPPVLTRVAASVAVNEGQTAVNSGTWGDIDSGNVTLSASVGAVIKNGDGTWSWQAATTDGPSQSQVVTIGANDNDGGMTSTTFNLTVNNVDPSVTITSPSYGSPYAMGSTVVINASFTDPGADSPWTCSIDWEGAITTGTVDQSAKTCTGSKPLLTAGLYTVTVKVTDKDGGFGTDETLVVVYDPNGSVTGGGWIDSPANAFPTSPSLVGRANFGFVSQYKKGATTPTGQTEFQFQVANLNFHSSVYEWLVVSGCKAQYKGTGTINGVGGYKFLLTATDGDKCAVKTADKFRIKITDAADEVVYDNRPGLADEMDTTDPQAITGGSIVIHQPAGKK